MKYSLIINPNRKSSQACEHALLFAGELIRQKHQISGIFFYGYAVKRAFFNDLNWNEAISHDYKLLVCSTIAQKYIDKGLVLASYYQISGLGDWVDALFESDKQIEFV